MSSIRKIIWVLPHPTPYNVYLLNELGKRVAVPSEAVYRWSTLNNHPWTALPERKFAWRIAANPGGRDSALENQASTDESTLFIFAGWRDRTIFPVMRRRWWKHYPHAFWSDTPKVEGGIPRKLVNAVQRFFASRAIAMLATGTPAIENYAKIGIPREKLRNFPFIVDPDHFAKAIAIRRQRPVGSPCTFVLAARLIDSLKGQRVAIRALAVAKKTIPQTPLRLIIAGVGPDEAALRAFAAEQGVAAETSFRGWVEYDDIPALFGSADALVLPSRWDPFPVAVIEAMAAGLPVLGSSACGSVQERVVDGVNGFIHSATEFAVLAEHMVAIASSTEMRAMMEKNALATSRINGIEEAAEVVTSLLREIEMHDNRILE